MEEEEVVRWRRKRLLSGGIGCLVEEKEVVWWRRKRLSGGGGRGCQVEEEKVVWWRRMGNGRMKSDRFTAKRNMRDELDFIG